MVYLKKPCNFQRFQRGSNIYQGGGVHNFQGGGPTFSRGGCLNANLYKNP